MNTTFRFSRARRAAILLAATGLLVAAGTVAAKDAPSLRILYTSSVKGYLDQCGCPVNPSGGIGRRATAIQRATDRAIPMLLLDGGDIVGEQSDVERAQTRYLFEAMKRMGYHAVGVGPRDLSYGVSFLRQAQQSYGLAFTSANLIDAANGRPVFAPYIVEEVGGTRGALGRRGALKVGVVSVMGTDRAPMAAPADPTFRVADPVATVNRTVGELRDRTDLIVILAYVDEETANRIAAANGVDAVIITRPVRVPEDWVTLRDHAAIGYSTFQGRGVVQMDLRLDRNGRVSGADGAMTSLTADIPDDPEMARLRLRFDAEKTRILNGD